MQQHQYEDCAGVWHVGRSGNGLVCTVCGAYLTLEPADMMAALRENSLTLLMADLANQGRQMRRQENPPLDR